MCERNKGYKKRKIKDVNGTYLFVYKHNFFFFLSARVS